MTDPRYTRALALIDEAHADDPRTTVVDNTPLPYELVYAQRMTEWLDKVAPEATIPLKLAVRAQHLRRWESPRQNYPMDRAGYHAWRTELKQRQAELAEELTLKAGFEESIGERVAMLVRKENLKQDQDTQALEDTTCLVFLAYYMDEFADRYDNDEKMINILAKTWLKMSEKGHQLTTEIRFSAHAQSLVEKALESL